jgi:hypothetical protein
VSVELTSNDLVSTPEKNSVEHTMRINTIRVALKRAAPDEPAFVVQRLREGEPLPASTMEAMLVLTGVIADSDANESPVIQARGSAFGIRAHQVLSAIIATSAACAGRCMAMISNSRGLFRALRIRKAPRL